MTSSLYSQSAFAPKPAISFAGSSQSAASPEAPKPENKPFTQTVSDVFIQRHNPSNLGPRLFDFYHSLQSETGIELSSLKHKAKAIWQKITHFLSKKLTYVKSNLVFNLGQAYTGKVSKNMYDMVERQALFAPLKLASLQRLDPALRQAIKRTRFFNVPALNGLELAAWHLPAMPGKPTILFNHGRNSNISSYSSLYRTFKKMGYGVFTYDYPGFGKSEGKPSVETIHHAALAAQEELIHRGVPASEQLIMGHSLGGAVAADLVYRLSHDTAFKNRQPKGLILINTLSNPKDLWRSQAKEYRLYFNWMSKLSLDPLKRFPEIETFFDIERKVSEISQHGIPTLILHANKDPVFPEPLGENLFHAAQRSAPKGTSVVYHKLEGDHYLRRSVCEQLPAIFKSFVGKIK